MQFWGKLGSKYEYWKVLGQNTILEIFMDWNANMGKYVLRYKYEKRD